MAKRDPVEAAYNLVTAIMDAERRRKNAADLRAFIERRNKENWQ